MIINFVNFIRLCSEEILGQTLHWVVHWGWFWMRLTFKSVGWVKHIALLNVFGLIQSVEDLNITKVFLPRNNYSCLLDLELQLLLFSAFKLELKQFSWVLCLSAFRLDLHNQCSCISDLGFRLEWCHRVSGSLALMHITLKILGVTQPS